MAKRSGLTDTESAVLRLVAEDLSNEQIAEKMGISKHWVEDLKYQLNTFFFDDNEPSVKSRDKRLKEVAQAMFPPLREPTVPPSSPQTPPLDLSDWVGSGALTNQLPLLAHDANALMYQVDSCKMLVERTERMGLGGFTLLRAEANRLLSLMQVLEAQGKFEELAWFISRLREFLFAEGYWKQIIDYSSRLLLWAERSGKVKVLGEIVHKPFDIWRRWGSFSDATEWLKKIEKAADQLKDERLHAEALLMRGRFGLYWEDPPLETREFTQHLDMIDRAMKIFEQTGEPEGILRALNAAGNLHLKQGRVRDAEPSYNEGLQEAKKSQGRPPLGSTFEATFKGNLAYVRGRSDMKAAREMLFGVMDDLPGKVERAELYSAIAYYSGHLGEPNQAKMYRRLAESFKEQLGIRGPVGFLKADIRTRGSRR